MTLACLPELRSLTLTEARHLDAVPAAYEVLRTVTSQSLEELSIAGCSEIQGQWPELSALLNGPKFFGLHRLIFSGWISSPNIADDLAVRSFLEQQFPSFAVRGIIQVDLIPVLQDAEDSSSESGLDSDYASDVD